MKAQARVLALSLIISLSGCFGPASQVSTLVDGKRLVFAKPLEKASDAPIPKTGWQAEDLAIDPDGTLWVADTAHHRILTITPTGVVAVAAGDDQAGFQDAAATDARFNLPQGIHWTPKGLLIADTANRKIRRLFKDQVSTELIAYPLERPVSVTQDQQGRIYVADAATGRIIRKQPQRAPEVLLQLEPFRLLQTIKLDDKDQLYYTDNLGLWHLSEGLRRRLISPTDAFKRLSGFAFWGSEIFLSDSYAHHVIQNKLNQWQALQFQLSEPEIKLRNPGAMVKVPGQEALLLAAPGQDKIYRVTADKAGYQLATFAQTGTQGFGIRSEGEDLSYPHGVIYDQLRKNYLVSDYYHQRLMQMDAQGRATLWQDKKSEAPLMNLPTGLAQDTSGNIYVCAQHQIFIIAPDGSRRIFAGSGQAGLKDGPAEEAQFWLPLALTVAADGSLYVADHSNHAIRRIFQGQVTTVAGSGEPGFRNGKGTEARFQHPSGIVWLPDGQLLVADSWNHQLRLIGTDGQVSTYAGTTKPGLKEGNRLEAEFYAPAGLVRSANGDIYIADSYNHRIRRLRPEGHIESIAGKGRWLNWDGGPGDGSGSSARFYQPMALALDPQQRIIVADTGNHQVRVVELK